MLNQMVIVGRLVRDPEIKELENGKKVSTITLAVPRSYKNAEGEYDTDFIDCSLWSGVAETAFKYCKKGDLLGIKGRVTSRSVEENGNLKNVLEVVAEKVTFLTSKKSVENNDIDENISI